MSINSDTKVINRLCIVKEAFVYKYINIHPKVELNKNVWISKMLKKANTVYFCDNHVQFKETGRRYTCRYTWVMGIHMNIRSKLGPKF